MSITNERQNDWSTKKKNPPRQHLHSRWDDIVTHAHRRPALRGWHGGQAARKRREVNTVQPFEVRTIGTKCAESPILHLWGKKTIKASFQYVSCKCLFIFLFFLFCLYNVIYKIRCDQKIQFNKKYTEAISEQTRASRLSSRQTNSITKHKTERE